MKDLRGKKDGRAPGKENAATENLPSNTISGGGGPQAHSKPLELELVDPADANLPRPPGHPEKKRPVNWREKWRLERTREAGGLIDDNATPGKEARARLVDRKEVSR